jgi:hypothetical protein
MIGLIDRSGFSLQLVCVGMEVVSRGDLVGALVIFGAARAVLDMDEDGVERLAGDMESTLGLMALRQPQPVCGHA